MAALSNHVSLAISQDSVGVARAGFGVPMILSATAAWAERIRFYSSLAEVAEDFAVTTSAEYRAASAMFSQNPPPERIAIGRSALPATQKFSLAATARNSHAYGLRVGGDGVTETAIAFTSDSAATVAEVHKAALAALNAVTGKNYLATYTPLVNPDDTFTAAADDVCTATAHGLVTGDGPFQLTTSAADLPLNLLTGTDYWIIKIDADTFKLATTLALALAGTPVDIGDAGTGTHTIADTASTVRPADPLVVTGSAAGEWFFIEVLDVNDFALAQNHADPGVATDLAAIALESSDWYGLYTMYNSNAYVLAAAAWVEANSRIYLADVQDTASITEVVTSSDTIDDLATLGYARTAGNYHPAADQMFGAAWMGKCLPLDPGSETWKFKSLAGVAAVTMTSTQRTNLRAKKGNSIETVAGVKITFEGTTSDGDFIDVIRGLDWLDDDMSKGVFGALAGAAKIPYTDAGVAVIEAEVRASLQRAIAMGILTNDPAPIVTVPKVATVSSGNRGLRLLPDVKFSATLAGAIHKVSITGVVSV